MKTTKLIICLAAATLLLAACAKTSTPPAKEEVVEDSTATETTQAPIVKNGSDVSKSIIVEGEAEENSSDIEEYNYEDAYWVATGADPAIAPTPYEYSGVAKLRGWMINMVRYGEIGEEKVHFHVLDSDLMKLPPPFQEKYQDYYIGKNSTEILEKLKPSNEQNPSTITVNRIKAPWEGTPEMDIVTVH